MTTKNYTPNTTKIEIHNGKLNFFEAPKTFANVVDTFANAKCKIACIDKETKSMIKARQTLIDEHTKLLEVVPDDENHKNEIARLIAEIEYIQNRRKDLITEVSATQYTLTTIDENVFWAYKEHKNGTLDKSEYIQAIAVWFNQFGAKAHKDTINKIITEIGMKKASNNEIYKSKGTCYISTLSFRAYIEMFYRTVADMMAKAGTIKEFDFEKAYYTEQ